MISLLSVEVLAVIILYKTDKSGLGATMISFLLVLPTLITWPILVLIDHRTARQPAKVLTEDELRQFKVKRALVIVGFIVLAIFAAHS